jgi:alkyldihydroxyacetonephosphate synthase
MLKCAPASIRLVDNTQFQFGQSLKPANTDWKEKLMEKAKKAYVLNYKKFKPDTMVVATLAFEGTQAEINAQHKKLNAIAAKYGGFPAGEKNGIRGYFMTFMIGILPL